MTSVELLISAITLKTNSRAQLFRALLGSQGLVTLSTLNNVEISGRLNNKCTAGVSDNALRNHSPESIM